MSSEAAKYCITKWGPPLHPGQQPYSVIAEQSVATVAGICSPNCHASQPSRIFHRPCRYIINDHAFLFGKRPANFILTKLTSAVKDKDAPQQQPGFPDAHRCPPARRRNAHTCRRRLYLLLVPGSHLALSLTGCNPISKGYSGAICKIMQIIVGGPSMLSPAPSSYLFSSPADK